MKIDYNQIVENLKQVHDPEISINIFDLGLIYNIEIDKARCGKVSNRLYFESKKESKVNQNMNIKTIYSYSVDNYYYNIKIMLKNLK